MMMLIRTAMRSCLPKALGLTRSLTKFQAAFASFHPSSNPEKDRLFESVRYTVNTAGLDYMHSIKNEEQWSKVLADTEKQLVVCFYAT